VNDLGAGRAPRTGEVSERGPTQYPDRLLGRDLRFVDDQGRRALREDLERLQELDDLVAALLREGREGVARRASFTPVREDRVGDGGQVATVAVGRRIAHVPQFAGQKLAGRDAALDDPLVAEVVDLRVAQIVAL